MPPKKHICDQCGENCNCDLEDGMCWHECAFSKDDYQYEEDYGDIYDGKEKYGVLNDYDKF